MSLGIAAPASSLSATSSESSPPTVVDPKEYIEFIDKVLMETPATNITKVFPSAEVTVKVAAASDPTSKIYTAASSTATSAMFNSELPANLKRPEQIRTKQDQRSSKKVFFGTDEEERAHAKGLFQQDASAPPSILSYEFPNNHTASLREHGRDILSNEFPNSHTASIREHGRDNRNFQEHLSTTQEQFDRSDISPSVDQFPVPVADVTKYASLSPIRRPLEGMALRHINHTGGAFSYSANIKSQQSLASFPGPSSSIVEKERFLKELKQLRMTLQK